MSVSVLRDSINDALSVEKGRFRFPVDFNGFLDSCVYIIVEIAKIMNKAYTSSPDSRDENIATARQSITELTDAVDLSGFNSDSASRLRSAFGIPTEVDKDVLYFQEKKEIADLLVVDGARKDLLTEYLRRMEDGLFEILLTIVDRDYELDIPDRVRQGREMLRDYGARIVAVSEMLEAMTATTCDE